MGQQHDPRHFSPSGLVFPLLPQLSPAHPLAALTACSTSGPVGKCLPQRRRAAVKALRAHCRPFPLRFLDSACSTCQHTLHLSACLSSSLGAGSVRAGTSLILLETWAWTRLQTLVPGDEGRFPAVPQPGFNCLFLRVPGKDSVYCAGYVFFL